MNKFLTTLVCLCFAISTLSAQSYSGGSGTEGDPYLISSNADWNTLATATNGNSSYSTGIYFLLTQNLTGITTIIGNSTSYFRGTFDGGGHTIGVSISTTGYYAGVFCYIYGATIKNLGVTGSITRASTASYAYAGGICGYASGSSTISNCYNTATISGTATNSSSYSAYVGGICGYASGSSTISNCYNTGNVTASGYSSQTYAGGICGNLSGSTISNCIAANASVTAGTTANAGRIVGYVSGTGTIEKCYASASMRVNGATRSSQNANSKDGKNLIESISANNIITYGDSIILYVNTDDITLISVQSSDNTIAEIWNNILVAKRAGSFILTATINWGENVFNLELNKTVNKKEATIIADTLSMIYGDTPPPNTYKYEGFVFNETESVLTKLPTFSCSGTSTSNVGNYTITPSGAEAENYSFIYKNGQLQIGKRKLRVIPDNLSRVYGDNNPTLTLQYEGFVNGNTASNISTKPTVATTATKTSPVGNYEITCSGGSNLTNYQYVYEKGNLEITKAPLTVTPANASRLYGATNPNFTLSYSGFKNSETKAVLTEEPQQATSIATLTSPVGPYPITTTGGKAQNYSFVYNTGILTVNKAIATIQADTISTIYGDTPQFTCHYSGFVNNETDSVLTKLPTYSSGTSTSNVGNYTITPSGAEAENYSFTYKNGQLQIGKRDLRAIPDNLSRVYGDNNPTLTLSYNGFVNGNTASNIYQPTATTTATKTSPTGNYEIACSGGTATNYNFIYEKGNLAITNAHLTITANNASRYWGVENPAFTVSYSGFKNSETKSILTKEPQLFCEATRLSPSEQYPITVSGGAAPNYEIIRVNGTLTVNKSLQPATVKLNLSNPNLVSGMGNALTLAIEQEDPLLSFQTDVTFPSFVSVDLDNIALSNRCNNAHILDAVRVSTSPNKYRFLIYSPSNTPIAGNTGELISIPLTINWNTAPTTYSTQTVQTSAGTAVFYLSETSKPEKAIANTSTTFYIHRMGDVNINGTVTISDIVAEVDYILGKNPQPFLFEAGDMNHNNAISILDLTQIVNVVLTQNTSASPALRNAAANTDYELSLSNLALDYSQGLDQGNIILSMNNSNPVVAMNWDLTLPENVTLDENNIAFIGDRTNRNKHTIAVNKLAEGNTWRFVIYSSQNREISDNSGELISIPVIINEQTTIGQFPVNLNVANLIFLDNGVLDEATPVCADGILANGVEITGIDELKIENEKMKIYPNPAKEYVHIQSEFPIQKIEIYNPMGKLVRIEPDITERIDVSSLSEGLYLVRIYGSDWVNTQKIIVVR